MIKLKAHNEHCRECKEAVYRLLVATYGNVQVNYDLNIPCNLTDYSDANIYADLAKIYQALQNHRGHNNFVKSKKLPRVDFFIPDHKIIIEFDESQHFTKPRSIALNLYPNEKKFGFSVDKWRTLCQDLNKRDNDPPYRDEQRAWYDTLRDFAPLFWGEGKILRLYSRDLVWCSLNPDSESDLSIFKRILMNENKKP